MPLILHLQSTSKGKERVQNLFYIGIKNIYSTDTVDIYNKEYLGSMFKQRFLIWDAFRIHKWKSGKILFRTCGSWQACRSSVTSLSWWVTRGSRCVRCALSWPHAAGTAIQNISWVRAVLAARSWYSLSKYQLGKRQHFSTRRLQPYNRFLPLFDRFSASVGSVSIESIPSQRLCVTRQHFSLMSMLGEIS